MDLKNLLRIDEDLLDIAHRLREIDERYVLYRNMRLKRFEIYANGALQIAVPYDRLDERTVRLARSTRLEYAQNVLNEIERNNARLDKQKQDAVRENILKEVENAL